MVKTNSRTSEWRSADGEPPSRHIRAHLQLFTAFVGFSRSIERLSRWERQRTERPHALLNKRYNILASSCTVYVQPLHREAGQTPQMSPGPVRVNLHVYSAERLPKARFSLYITVGADVQLSILLLCFPPVRTLSCIKEIFIRLILLLLLLLRFRLRLTSSRKATEKKVGLKAGKRLTVRDCRSASDLNITPLRWSGFQLATTFGSLACFKKLKRSWMELEMCPDEHKGVTRC